MFTCQNKLFVTNLSCFDLFCLCIPAYFLHVQFAVLCSCRHFFCSHGNTTTTDSSPVSRLPRRTRALTPEAAEKRSRLDSSQDPQPRSLSESGVVGTSNVKRLSANFERVSQSSYEEVPVSAPSTTTDLKEKKPKKPKKKFGRSKTIERVESQSVSTQSLDDTAGVQLRSKSMAKITKVRRSGSHMFPHPFRNRSKTSGEKLEKKLNRDVKSCKEVSEKDKSSSMDRLKVRLSKSRSSSLKRAKSLRSSNNSINSGSLSASLSSMHKIDDRPTLNLSASNPLLTASNPGQLPPPPPPRPLPRPPTTPDIEIESEYAEFGDVADKTVADKTATLPNRPRIQSAYEDIEIICPPSSNKRSSSESQRPSGIPSKTPQSPIKRRGAQRRLSKQQSIDVKALGEVMESDYASLGEAVLGGVIESDYASLGDVIESDYATFSEMDRPSSLVFNREQSEDPAFKTPYQPPESPFQTPDSVTPLSRPVPRPRPGRSDGTVEVDSIYCEFGDMIPPGVPEPGNLITPKSPQSEDKSDEDDDERIDMSRYRKDSQSSAYDLSDSDEDSPEDPVYSVVRKDRITSSSQVQKSESLKFVLRDQVTGTSTIPVFDESEGEMYYPTSDSSYGSPEKGGSDILEGDAIVQSFHVILISQVITY